MEIIFACGLEVIRPKNLLTKTESNVSNISEYLFNDWNHIYAALQKRTKRKCVHTQLFIF